MFNARGQEGAPFELLVAVIVMGFVIFAGMNAMNVLWKQRCYGTIDAKIEEFKTSLETVVGQKSHQVIYFRLSECFDEQDESIRITDSDDPKFCAEYCGSPKKTCTLLQYSNTGSTIFGIRKCLNIPPDTHFPSARFTDQKCPKKEGYELQDFTDSIPQGYYILTNKTSSMDTFSTICAYKRAEGA